MTENAIYTTHTRIEERVWDVGDTYLVVPEFQVDEPFKKGDRVKVTVEKVRE